MAQAIGDPDELEHFAQALMQFIETLNEAQHNLNNSFNALGDTWRDEKRMKFEDDYNTLLQQLSQFEQNASEQIPYINMLASKLRDYIDS